MPAIPDHLANDEARLPIFELCGVPITAVGLDGAVEAMLRSRFGQGRSVHLCNAYTLALAAGDARFRQLLRSAGMNLADGHPVAVVGRRRGFPGMSTRAYGPDVMLGTLDRGRARKLRHYLYGASPEVVLTLAAGLRNRFPGVDIAGVESPPYRDLTEAEVKALMLRVRAARADLMWVGLGTPRQDEFIARHASDLNCTLVAVGAAFDFLAGAKRQAPMWMRQRGLEWFFRLVTEPRRLWRRYLTGNAVFAFYALREEIARVRRGTSLP